MRIAVIGIGGIGGYIGSKLCKAYAENKKHEIIFIQRGDHYRKIKESGLTYIAKSETTVFPSELLETTENAGLFDLVFITVKSRDLEQTARSLKKNLHSQSIIITTLNGVNNARRLENELPTTAILNGCIYVSAAIQSPGIVKQMGGVGNLFFGPENGNIEPYIEIETLLIQSGIKAELSDNIKKIVWEKYIFICSWSTISSEYALPLGAILENKAKYAELRLLLTEIALIADALNVGLNDDVVEQCLERFDQLPYDNKTSFQLDIENGKNPEIDIMIGYIVDCAVALGIEVPAHRAALKILGY